MANLKQKDYDQSGEVEAGNEYAAWGVLRNSESPLSVGDLLETPEGHLRICKYVGFEDARWFVPEPGRHVKTPAPAAEGAQPVQA